MEEWCVTVGCYGVKMTVLNAHIIANVVCAPTIVRHTKTHNEKKDIWRERLLGAGIWSETFSALF